MIAGQHQNIQFGKYLNMVQCQGPIKWKLKFLLEGQYHVEFSQQQNSTNTQEEYLQNQISIRK